MQAASTAFRTSIEGSEATVAVAVNVTLPNNVASNVTAAVESFGVDSSITTDVPDDLRMTVGYPARSADLVLSGLYDLTDERKTMAWLFSPYQTTSPLYRKPIIYSPVTIDAGVYVDGSRGTPELIRIFTGYIDDYAIASDGTVKITCIDGRSLLRNLPAMAAVIPGPPYNAGLTSEYALDAIVRAASNGTFGTWPALRSTVLLAAGMRSSVWPEVGTLNAGFLPAAPSFTPGRFGSALTNTGPVSYTVPSSSGPGNGSDFVEFWADLSTGASVDYVQVGRQSTTVGAAGTGGWFLTLRPDGSIQLGFGTPTMTTVAAGTFTASASHYFALSLRWDNGQPPTYAVWVDGTQVATGTATATGNRPTAASFPNVLVYATGRSKLEALQLTNEAINAPRNHAFVPQAVLDPSLNALVAIPDISGDPWAVIQDIATAELGVAGFDERNIFRFTNRRNLRLASSSRDISAASSLIDLGITVSAANVCNHAQVGYTPWIFGTPTAVWNAAGVRRVPVGTASFLVKLDGLATLIKGTGANLPNSTNPLNGNTYFRASTTKAGTTEATGITVTAAQVTSGTVRITTTNRNTVDAFLVSPSNYTDLTVGTPALWIGGTPVTAGDETVLEAQWPPATNGGAASSPWGDQAYQLSGNRWIQDDDTAAQLAYDLATDTPTPRPDFDNVSIVADPRLQLGDRVRLYDPDNTAVVEYVRLYGQTFHYGTADDTHTIQARTVTTPGSWILAVAGRTELGTNTNL